MSPVTTVSELALRTLKNTVVVWVSGDYIERVISMQVLREAKDLLHGIGDILGSPVELVMQDARRLGDDGVRDRELDLAGSSEVENLKWLTAKVEGRDVNVGISGNAAHLPPASFVAETLDDALEVIFRGTGLSTVATSPGNQ